MQVQLSEPKGACDDFYRIPGEREILAPGWKAAEDGDGRR